MRCIVRAAMILLTTLSCVCSSQAQNSSAKIAYFENHIRPLLAKHCFECHNDKKQEGGVRLDLRDAMMKGGDSGPTVVPGKPEDSLLIEAVRYEGLEMPPDAPLDDAEINKLVRWVKQGAVWPHDDTAIKPTLGDQNAIRAAADSHWAFQPLQSPPFPTTSDPDWANHPIDRFVLDKLDQNELRPSPPADRKTLIRRAFIDLVGLPPTPETIHEVFGDDGLRGKNFVSIIDTLLASPHYGERMARHWMDVARYADTRDFQAAADMRYPYAYTYRDWLISAFNRDLPFDQFVRYQLAADHLVENTADPNLAALGFLTVGPMFRNNTLERIADRVDVVTRGLMGLTGSCARCHDHKYDPVSIEDYYSLYGVFRDSVRPNEFPVIDDPLGRKTDSQLVDDFNEKLANEKQKLFDYESELAATASDSFQARAADYLLSYLELSIEKSETTRGLKSKRSLEETALTPIANNLDQFRKDKSNATHPVLGPIVDLLSAPDPQYARRKESFLKRYGKDLDPLVRTAVVDSSNRREFAKLYGQFLTKTALSDDESSANIRNLVVHPTEGPFVITPKAASAASRLLGKGRQVLLKYQQAIADVEATHPGAPPKAMILQDAKRAAPLFVMYRGEASRRGPRVQRGFLDYFADADSKVFKNGSGRLELANSIVSPNNPLTARVIVNRVWRMHFGNGLVDDAGDFGLRSEQPEQLALLDFLASSLIQHDWSLQWLHRTIMLSKTYRQSSSAMNPPTRDDGTPATEIDSENQLLWRQNRRRLDFESMRDSMLDVAGTLDRSLGGRSVRLDDSPHCVRRTVYSYVDRVDPNPLFATFDVPSASVSSAQRTQTLVPQQALFAMNNSFVTEQARAIVARDDFQHANSDADRIELLFNRILQRPPRPNERLMLSSFLDEANQLSGEITATWAYGYGAADGTTNQFTPLTFFDGKRYTFESDFPSPTHGYIQHSRSGGHPGRSSQYSSIRRWIAPDSMTVRIAGTLARPSDRGDGIRAIIQVAGQTVFESDLDTGQTKTVAGYHLVKPGDTIDFIVDPKRTTTSDGYRWTVLIEQRDQSKKKVLRSWHSARMFAGPPPPAMTPWEQTAQALLMTNEFLFVD